MENVKNLVGSTHKPNFEKWLKYLESLGYSNYWKVLNAVDFGVPQSRERVFCISILYLKEEFRWNYLVGFLFIILAVFFIFKR